MKIFKPAIILVCFLCLVLNASSQTFSWQGIKFEVVSEVPAVAKIVDARRCMAHFIMPKTVTYNQTEYAVKVMGNETFSQVDCMYGINLSDVEVIEDGYVTRYADNGTVLYHGCFQSCSKLNFVNFSNLRSIGDYAFHACQNLPKAEMWCVEHVGKYAFQNCYALKELVLGESLQSLGEGCFANSANISVVQVHAVVPPVCPPSVFEERVYQQAVLQVPEESMEAYAQAEGWKNFTKVEVLETVGIAPMSNSDIDIHILPSSVFVQNVSEHVRIDIFEWDGKKVKSVYAPGHSFEIGLQPGRGYLIQIGEKNYKVFL